MKFLPLVRAAAFGLAALPALSGTAAAFDLPRLCSRNKEKEVERVVLPQREVEIITERPRVVVREAAPAREMVREVVRESSPVREVIREAAPVTTVYMPVAPPREREVVREVMVRDEGSSFESSQRAIVRGEMAKLELQRTIEMQRKVLECYPVGGEGRGSSSSALEQRVDQLRIDLEKINTRLTSVEKLLMYHDKLLLAKKGEEGVEFDGLKTRLDNLERLTLYLEKKATSGVDGGDSKARLDNLEKLVLYLNAKVVAKEEQQKKGEDPKDEKKLEEKKPEEKKPEDKKDEKKQEEKKVVEEKKEPLPSIPLLFPKPGDPGK